jgi:hypothetical protein
MPTFSSNDNTSGVLVTNTSTGEGVHGETTSSTMAAVAGNNSGSGTGAGVFGKSTTGEGVHGETASGTLAAVAGTNTGGGVGVFGKGGSFAGFFEGNVGVTGRLTVGGQDVIADLQLISPLRQEVNGIRQQVTSVQQQLASLQQTLNQDVQGIATKANGSVDGESGGIYAYDSTLTLVGTNVKGNKATTVYNDIFNGP